MALTASKVAPIVAASVEGGFDIPQYPYNEANSATFKTGAILIGSSGDLVEATTGVNTLIVGVAQQAGTNNAAAPQLPTIYGGTYPAGSASSGPSAAGTSNATYPLLVVPAMPGVIFEGTFANNDVDTAVAATDMWVRYGLSKDTGTGFWYVDGNLTTTNSAVVIVGIKNLQDITLGTTTGVRVFFKFLVAATAFGATA